MHSVPSYFLARASVALAVFAALLGSTAPSPLYPTYLQTFSLSHAMVTEIFATYALGTLVALLVSSRIGSSVSDPRRMMLPGLVITAAGALTFAFAHDVTMLLAGRFLNGIGTGGITAMASASLYELSPPHKRGQAATLATLAFTGGAAGGPLMSSAAIALNFAPTVSPFLFIVAVACVAGLGLILSSWPDWKTKDATDSGSEDPEERSRAVIPLFVLSCIAVGIAWMVGSFIMAVCQRRSKIRPRGGAKVGHLWRAHETAGTVAPPSRRRCRGEKAVSLRQKPEQASLSCVRRPMKPVMAVRGGAGRPFVDDAGQSHDTPAGWPYVLNPTDQPRGKTLRRAAGSVTIVSKSMKASLSAITSGKAQHFSACSCVSKV